MGRARYSRIGLTPRDQKRLREQTWQEILLPYGLDRNAYSAGTIEPQGEWPVHYPWDVVFEHKKTGARVRVSRVYFNEMTGEILQVGKNYGELTF